MGRRSTTNECSKVVAITTAKPGKIRLVATTVPTALPSREDLFDALRHVVDPELHDNVVDLGMVRDASVSADGMVTVEIALTIAGCPMRTQLRQETEAKLRAVPGVTDVKVTLGEMTQAERSALMQRARKK